MKNKILIYIFVILAVFSTGCRINKKAEISTPAKLVCVEGVQRKIIMKAVEDVLIDMGFTIDKFDIDAGFISTEPLRAKQFFELWRGDTAKPKDTAAANIHTERRTVTVAVANSDMCVDCRVLRERLSVLNMQAGGPEDSFTGVSEHIELGEEEALEMDAEEVKWDDMGKDEYLRAEILQRFENKMKI
jgi:hypothetical protein